MVVVLAPPVILSQCFLFHLTVALTRNALDCVALVALACPALLPVVGHHILSIGPAPEVALILRGENQTWRGNTFTFLCSAAVNTLQPVPEIQYEIDVHNLGSMLGRDVEQCLTWSLGHSGRRDQLGQIFSHHTRPKGCLLIHLSYPN